MKTFWTSMEGAFLGASLFLVGCVEVPVNSAGEIEGKYANDISAFTGTFANDHSSFKIEALTLGNQNLSLSFSPIQVTVNKVDCSLSVGRLLRLTTSPDKKSASGEFKVDAGDCKKMIKGKTISIAVDTHANGGKKTRVHFSVLKSTRIVGGSRGHRRRITQSISGDFEKLNFQ